MAISVSTALTNTNQITVSESDSTTYGTTITQAGSSTSSRSIVGGNAVTLTHGLASGEMNWGDQTTGVLSPGGTTTIDLTAFPSQAFNTTTDVNFSSVKSVVLTNSWTGPDGSGFASGYPCDAMGGIGIAANGANGFTGLFNGGTGNIKVHPFGSFSHTDWCGIPVESVNKNINIIDIDGSGAYFELTVVGITGA